MTWQKAASLDDFGDRDAIGIELAGVPVALFRLGGEVRATSGICTHELAALADGYVEPADGSIECPLHQARFDIRSGRALCAPAGEDLKVYPVKIDGVDILIDPDGAENQKVAPASAETNFAAAKSKTSAGASVSDNGRAKARSEVAETAAAGIAASNGGPPLRRDYVWPGDDLTLVPDWVYTGQNIYEREIERIFHGRT
jgi:apoptosis-inducing factor 3